MFAIVSGRNATKGADTLAAIEAAGARPGSSPPTSTTWTRSGTSPTRPVTWRWGEGAAGTPRLGPRNRRDHRLPRLVRAGYISGVTLPMDGGFMALGLAEQ
ncbi:hypothetical protein SSPO_026100 [Streptomyces antimycoticus]|uniref:Uncharacterized protein n=1 Tax=Streptomyces antimycoticus TaxID=68175 RepID=A0A499UH14_9ACTN|nr:hypothetical protein [Streptomyces antimycoticus]BBJ39892.1 hypothetical protein SSPO_026100 [Streptomyces antimycoticus]